MVGTRPRVPAWLVPSLIIIVESAFLPVMGNGFVNWDDPAQFIYNNDFRGFGGPQIRWAWSTFLLGVYQPLAWMVLEVQYVVWGLDPRGRAIAP
jgi:protein O-mannosyl-transferase